ncbi:MAG: energy transducer TonB [Bacteroidota bacterium]|nr:energy transducer TonB [Bacteroidota bacterium]
MNKETILQSNLLDIIFDKRNKDYGAYTLRKNYNSRIHIALFLMMLTCLAFCLLFFLRANSVALKNSAPVFFVADKTITEYHETKTVVNKSVAKVSHAEKIRTWEAPPKIVDEININKLPATPQEILSSSVGEVGTEINFPGVAGSDNVGGKDMSAETVALPQNPKPGPLETAEVMPEYPGGIKALLLFLKKNLQAPEDVADGNEVSVKVKFIVNYNGKLDGFDVIKSGGTAFDDEVLRVLKKMPLWIPGKSNGQNVSVYYVVPVKFTTEF